MTDEHPQAPIPKSIRVINPISKRKGEPIQVIKKAKADPHKFSKLLLQHCRDEGYHLPDACFCDHLDDVANGIPLPDYYHEALHDTDEEEFEEIDDEPYVTIEEYLNADKKSKEVFKPFLNPKKLDP